MSEMNREKIKESLVDIVSNVLDLSPDSITEDMELGTDLKVDSLALYEIVVDMEERFSIRVSNDEADDLKTIRDAVDFVERCLRGA